MHAPAASIRALAFHRRLPLPRPHPLTLLRLLPRPPPCRCPTPARSLMAFSAEPAGEEAEEEALPPAAAVFGDGGEVSTEEWRRWGTSSPLPAMVTAVVRELLEMESEAGEKMRFGGVGSKLKGDFKDMEDKKHRAVYETLADSDKKLQYFSARQIACRLLGSRGYLCQKCWLPTEDCMCAKLAPCNLWRGIRFWLYMHPKDFLRQNNTGKLLWQVFGIQAAPLCLFGIQEHEDIMWDAFKRSGKGKVSFLYPNKSTTPKSVKDLKFDSLTLSWDLEDVGPDHELFPAQEALLHIQTHIVDLGPDKDNIITTRLLVPSSEISCFEGRDGSLSDIQRQTSANVQILPREDLPTCALESDELIQIVGEIRAARNALMQVTTKLRSYLYREMSGPNQIGNINVHGSISPAKGSPRGLYQGNDLPMAAYQQAQQMTTSWHSKDSGGSASGSFEQVSNINDDIRQSAAKRFAVPLVTRSTLEVVIPKSAVASLTMRSGSKLAQISEMSGATVTFAEDRPEVTEKVVRISGTPEQADKAQSLLQGFILSIQDDIPSV